MLIYKYKTFPKPFSVFIGIFIFTNSIFAQLLVYPWLGDYHPSEVIIRRIDVPIEHERFYTESGSFGDWLRHLPLKSGHPPVYLHNGSRKANQEAHFAVIDIDVGERNIQQCADAVMRLRAEYLYSLHQFDHIHFNFTNGDTSWFRAWINGKRPIVNGSNVRWDHTGRLDSSYSNFETYLQSVFKWAGSLSLSRELRSVGDIQNMQIGDIFIQGGSPGHVVLVVDMAIHRRTGKKCFLLIQSFMPAQDVHILKNPNNPEINPWYELEFGDTLITPEWTFTRHDLMRF